MYRLLIIEDDLEMVSLITKASEAEGQDYTIEFATDGESGLEKAISNSYELVIVDFMLPKLNGLDVCKSFEPRRLLADNYAHFAKR